MDVKNEVNNTVKDIQNDINGIEEAYTSVDTLKAKDYRDKAIRVLAQAIAKLENVYESVSDPEEIKEVLNFVKEKSNTLTKTTLEKINALKENEQVKSKVDLAKEKLNEVVETIKENEKVKNVIDKTSESYDKFVDNAKENIDNLLAKSEVNEKIEKAKDVTIDVCEKAVASLKAWLKPEIDEEDKQ